MSNQPAAPSVLPHFPGRPAIDAYGNGGFRFAGMSHRGHLVLVPSGVFGVEAADAEALTRSALDLIGPSPEAQTVLLVGTGRTQIFLSPETRQLFADRRIGLESMDTGAACRTYNILLAEKRAVAAAVMAVD